MPTEELKQQLLSVGSEGVVRGGKITGEYDFYRYGSCAGRQDRSLDAGVSACVKKQVFKRRVQKQFVIKA